MDPHNALLIGRTAFRFAATLGTARIIKDTLLHFSPTTNIPEKVMRVCSGIAITGLVQNKIEASADMQFDKNVAEVKSVIAKFKDQPETPLRAV